MVAGGGAGGGKPAPMLPVLENGGGGKPPCPPVPPHPGLPNDQVQQNVDAALDEWSQLLGEAMAGAGGAPNGTGYAGAATVASSELLNWLYQQFRQNGAWDYKNNQTLTGGDQSNVAALRDFGNFNFGAVMGALGFNLKTTISTGGIYQMFFLKHDSEGYPFATYPYGDFLSRRRSSHKGVAIRGRKKEGVQVKTLVFLA